MQKLQEALSDPDTMNQINQLAQMLGMGEEASPNPPGANGTPPPAPNPFSAPPASGFSEENDSVGGDSAAPPAAGSNSFADMLGAFAGGSSEGGFDINLLMKLQQLMQMSRQDDNNTNLLLALRPLLQEEKQQKVDRAVKLMRAAALFTAAKESGILEGLNLFG